MHRTTLCALLLAMGASPALAQWTATFDVDATASSFVWTGSSSLGPLQGNPSNTFQMDGTVDLTTAPGGGLSIGTANFEATGDAFTIPGTLKGKVPNPIFFLPPLATFEVVDLHLTVGSDPFPVNAAGDWTGDPWMLALSGTMNIVPLVGSASAQDLTGLLSDPITQSGTLAHAGGDITLTADIDSTFAFDDPSSGVSGSITLTGMIVADWSCPAPTTYCTAKVNSQGCTPAISASGTPSYGESLAFTIDATNIVNKKNGLLFYGYGSQATPFQGGTMCVAAPRKRTPVQDSGGSPTGADCTGAFSLDMNARIQSGVDAGLVPGADVYAQYWSRDPQSPGTTNLTDATRFTVCP
jgi:hypothetical protein